jgi:excisionase family DNA binding protein
MRPQLKILSGATTDENLPHAERPPTLASLLTHRQVSSMISPARAASRDAASDDVIDVVGVVRLLHVGRNKVYEMVARNEIPHRRFGRGIRFSRTAIMRWLDSWSPRIAKEGQ